MGSADGDEGGSARFDPRSTTGENPASAFLFSVAEKTRIYRRICRVAFELLPECRTLPRSASISTEAVPLRKKPFAIGKRDSQDRSTMAA
jgi:hypothetical protein